MEFAEVTTALLLCGMLLVALLTAFLIAVRKTPTHPTVMSSSPAQSIPMPMVTTQSQPTVQLVPATANATVTPKAMKSWSPVNKSAGSMAMKTSIKSKDSNASTATTRRWSPQTKSAGSNTSKASSVSKDSKASTASTRAAIVSNESAPAALKSQDRKGMGISSVAGPPTTPKYNGVSANMAQDALLSLCEGGTNSTMSEIIRAWCANGVPERFASITFMVPALSGVAAERLEEVRIGRIDLTKQSYFQAPGPHHALYLSLQYLQACPAVSSWHDCSDALGAYEDTLQRQLQAQQAQFQAQTQQSEDTPAQEQAPVEVHALYILACSRLLASSDRSLQYALLSRFATEYGTTLGRTVDQGGWLTTAEAELLRSAAADSGDATAKPDAWMELKTRWENVRNSLMTLLTQARKKSAHKAPDWNIKSAKRLMELVGQRALKETLVEQHEELLAHYQRTVAKNGSSSPSALPKLFVLVGNTGTGKTTAAGLFAQVLGSALLRDGHKVVTYTAKEAMRCGDKHFAKEIATLTGTTAMNSAPPPTGTFRKGMHVEVKHGDRWYAGQVTQVNKSIAGTTYTVKYADGTEEDINESGNANIRCVTAQTTSGGMLILDDAHLLDPSHPDGQGILDSIADLATDPRLNRAGVVLTTTEQGYTDKLCAHLPALQDRFQVITLDPFTEVELQALWTQMCKEVGWVGDAEEQGVKVSAVAARKLAQASAAPTFGNARAVKALLNAAIVSAKRRTNQNKQLAVEDIVGVAPDPARVPALAAALQELHACTGLQAVKDAVQVVCDTALSNYHKALRGQRLDAIPVHRLFLGNPGTGKSTVAAIYGRILKHLHLLSKGDVVSRKASDFIASFVGQSESQTRRILDAARGCVLIIDEAYTLNESPQYGKAVLNTLVECVSGDPGEDIAVILIGYERDMLRMLDEQNPGLRSRFDPAYAFRFEDFSDLELLQIFGAACVRDQVEAPIEVKRAAVKQLVKLRAMKNFGNARAVMGLYNTVKGRLAQRLRKDPSATKAMTLADVLGREEVMQSNPLQCIEELQGGDDEHGFRTVLRQLGSSIQICQMENRPVDAVGNFIFTGAPGTGKTTVARKMAQMLHGLGVLASDHVVQTTALDLTGQFSGQSKKVVEGKMEEARGGVLFIDEAYKLGEGAFGDEVMVKLLGMLTEPDCDPGGV